MENAMQVAAWAAMGAAVALGLTGMLIIREVGDRGLKRRAARLSGLAAAPDGDAAVASGTLLLSAIARLGNALRGTFFFAERDAALLERAVRSAGFDGRRGVAVVLGAKAVLLLLGPLVGYAVAWKAGFAWHGQALGAVAGMAAGTFLPNWMLGWARRQYLNALRKGLPDALDLLVVCMEAGLGLESAVERVAGEMRGSNPQIALEFSALLQDMRLASDRRIAFERLGERTGLDSFVRLGGTMSQTLRYGTPIGQALRVLAAEMRHERMIRLEEKAARLPALLVLPMIVFILPCLFIVLAGPAAIRILDVAAGAGSH